MKKKIKSIIEILALLLLIILIPLVIYDLIFLSIGQYPPLIIKFIITFITIIILLEHTKPGKRINLYLIRLGEFLKRKLKCHKN